MCFINMWNGDFVISVKLNKEEVRRRLYEVNDPLIFRKPDNVMIYNHAPQVRVSIYVYFGGLFHE